VALPGRAKFRLRADFHSSWLVAEGVLIFLGKRQPFGQRNYELLLGDLDRLLPLYKYAESNGSLQPISAVTAAPFKFRPGCTAKQSSAVASQAQRELDMNLRHNDLQEALYRRLADQCGGENIGTELPSSVSTSIDVVVCQETVSGFTKPRLCTHRAPAFAKLSDNCLSIPFGLGPKRQPGLIVVGETALDEEGAEYLRTLRERFSLPLEYEQIEV
jgi:hypothetical protein